MPNKKRSERGRSNSSEKLTAKQLQKTILQLFRDNPTDRFTPKQIIGALDLKNSKDAVRHAIEQLQADGALKTAPALKSKDSDTSRTARTRRKRDDDEAVRHNKPDYKTAARPKSRSKSSDRKADERKSDEDKPELRTRDSRRHADRLDESSAHRTASRQKTSSRSESDSDAPNRASAKTSRKQQDSSSEEPAQDRQAKQRRQPEQVAAPAELANDELIGRVDLSRNGSGYVVVEGRDQDVFVPQRRLAGAMNGDTVHIRYWTPSGRNKPEGEVLDVTNRKVDHFLGIYRDGRKYGTVVPDRIEYEFDVAVAFDDAEGAQDGDHVVVKVTQWPDRAGRNPHGIITEVLGATGSTDLEMKGILINQGFELQHSAEALAESEAIPDEVPEAEAEHRLDLREVLTFTIDPYDAKDFDDAISYRRLENGRLEIGVHIADVSHYVKANSALDAEAAKSTTSVYLVDRVLPMLPEKLSNGVCSLRPNEDKCTFSALFEFDDKDIIRKTTFAKTLTHSDRRFTYDDAQDLIEGQEDELTEVVQHVNALAKKLRARRFRNGAIDFDSEEVRFKLDEDGQPIDAYVKSRRESNMLVEDFMLLANKSVAQFIAKKGSKEEIPFPYRVHDEPDPDKMANLATFAAKFGVKLDLTSPKLIAKSYNKLTKLASERPELAVLSPLAIRTMAKAEYTTDNIGHYGLGFENYTHFTSPIRRYADVLVHRILEQNLLRKEYRTDKDALEKHCKHISERERAAVKAERESTSYFQVLYIRDHIGEEFDGTVNGVIDRGIFVQLDGNYCEGMAPFETMADRYELDDARLVATGRKSGRKLQMGSAVRVQIVSADPDTRRIEMSLIGEEGEHSASAKPVERAGRRTERNARGRGHGGAHGSKDSDASGSSTGTKRRSSSPRKKK